MIQYSTVAALFDDHGSQAIVLLAAWATLLLGAAWMLASLLRRASSAVRCCVWQFALMGLLVLPVLCVILPGIPLGLARTRSESTPERGGVRSTTHAARNAVTRPDLPPGVRSFAADGRGDVTRSSNAMKKSVAAEVRDSQHFTSESPGAGANDMREATVAGRGSKRPVAWSAGLVGGWALGVVMQLAWLVCCVRRAGRLVGAAVRVDDVRVSRIQADVQRRLSLSRRVRVRKSATVCTPVVVGIRHPSILLPSDCMDWPAEKIRMVLSHELAHVERRDVFWQLVARTAAALYWFHPLAWLALRRMRRESERACDDRVLFAGVPAVDYAAGLAEFAAVLAGRPLPLVGSLGMAEPSPLEDRVRSILDASAARNPASVGARGTLLAVTTSLVLLLGVMRPFSPAPTAAADGPKSDDKSPSASAGERKSDAESAVVSGSQSAPPDDDETVAPKQLPTQGSMLVRVLGPDGQPIAGTKLLVNVTAWDGNATEWDKHRVVTHDDYVSGPEGSVEITLPKVVADLRLWASKEGYVPMFVIWCPEDEPELAAIPEVFTYHLRQGTILGGIVMNDDREPIEGVKVEARYHAKGEQASEGSHPVVSPWLAEGESTLHTDSEGRWKLDNVPPGDDVDVRVKLSHPDYIDDRDWGELQKEQHITTTALRAQTAVIVMHRGTVVTGTITDPDGKPVKDAVVIWGDRPYWEQGSQEVRTDEQGVYRFPPLRPGPMHVTVVAAGWMPDRTKIEIAAGLSPVNFVLKQGKKLRVRIVDQSGAAVSRVRVSISKWHGAESLYNVRHPNVLDTGIPGTSDANGMYEWHWAPDSPVELTFRRDGFAEGKTSITADESEHVFTLFPRMRIAGTAVDADTGQPIEEFMAVPIIYFQGDSSSVQREDALKCTGGEFSMKFDRCDVEHGLQFEARGHATVRTNRYPIGTTVPPLEIRMTPATRFVGRVLDEAALPVANARVYVGSYSEQLSLYEFDTDDGGLESNYRARTNDRGEFEIAHQFERYALTVVSDAGYGEADRPVGELPGVVTVRPWAKLRGRLVQAGEPVCDVKVVLELLRDQGGDAASGNVTCQARTGVDGSFEFARVPPVPCRVQAFLHWSAKSELTSSESLPIVPLPGEEIDLSLGGGGIEVSARLVLDPDAPPGFDYHFALNYLVALRPGVPPPPPVAKKGFDWGRGWSDAWLNTLEGWAYLQTLHHYFVKPEPDGRIRISGVAPGEYDLAIHLYGSTEGCLVHPVGVAVVRVTVPEGQSAVDLGTIKVASLQGLAAGDAAPEFVFTTPDGSRRKLTDWRGQYLLVDFWATWCEPCVAKLAEVESLRQKYVEPLGLVVIGANLDHDERHAREFLSNRNLPWQHALLGDWSSTDVPRRFAVSSVPTYVLIGPDGRIVASELSLDAIAAILDKATGR